MRRNGDRGLVGGDREILDRGYGFHRTGDRWLPDRWLGMPGQIVTPPGGGDLVDGDPVSIWPDSSGTGHDATQSGSNRPIYKTNVINGKPVMRFDSALSQYLKIPIMTADGPWTMFAVTKMGSGPYLSVIGQDLNTSSYPPSTLVLGTDGNINAGSKIDYGYYAGSGFGVAPHVFTVNFIPGTGYWIRMDGNAFGPGVTGLVSNFDFNAIGRAGTLYSGGDMAEIIFYRKTFYNIDVPSAANIEKYLGTKYGITVAGGTAVDPFTIQGLQGWWKADATVPPLKLNDGDAVTEWTDNSGNGHHARATGSNRPIYKVNIVNGRPVVRFTTSGASKLDLATPISGGGYFTCFAVLKAVSSGVPLFSLAGDFPGPYGPLKVSGQGFFADRNYYFNNPLDDSGFHVITARTMPLQEHKMYFDGIDQTISFGAQPSSGDFKTIGYRLAADYSDGDLAEIIHYQDALALRAKLLVMLTVLVTTGQLPPPTEADIQRIVGNRDRIQRYLHRHGVTVSPAELDAVVEPFAAGDRANIEAYLGTKYGITVAGGTAVQPDTVAGLAGWWKADSLL
jgi:hypothetical protein